MQVLKMSMMHWVVLSAHPVDACKGEDNSFISEKKAALTLCHKYNQCGCFNKAKNKNRIAFGEFGDGTANMGVAFFDDVYQKLKLRCLICGNLSLLIIIRRI